LKVPQKSEKYIKKQTQYFIETMGSAKWAWILSKTYKFMAACLLASIQALL
jgi:hypothetical protein